MTVFITNINGWWVIYGEGTPIKRYQNCTKKEAKSRYYNEFIKPLKTRHFWEEVE